ncbi:PEP-CTERM sorting domain-containing protein [Massilia pseudoviolaceinigra]|uniref:PEP-CTERM sorting domain-containing protein n=1 Tax=Massilia pseudoviolaceinigra TaxID=3057165 RepID=UPI0027964598|nr:PEP-CTERM sorting domain-containing protein [Massilia sp. CCM 9206]MDQ1922510.1 PEP-CTERM sorting domain-containing protein [Massilia sp. CCM 9206]
MLNGRFFAEDRDLNGVFSSEEVTSFTIYGQSFTNCTSVRQCGVSNFSFTPGGALTFSAYDSVESGKWREGWSRTTRGFEAGRRFYTSYENDWSVGSVHDYEVTAQTRFAISAVPEPQTWLMMGAGIALLGAAKRRSRRSRKA